MKIRLNEFKIRFKCSPKLVMSLGVHNLYCIVFGFLTGGISISMIASCGHDYPTETVVSGRIYAERADDVSWENELVGFRIYGPGTQAKGEKAYGYDIFFKHPTKDLIVPQLYAPETDPETWRKVDSLRAINPELAEDYIKTFSYHIDHGLGMDCYAVGPTLGAGVAALVDSDTICYPWCYEKAEILENGPLRFTVRLDFAPRQIGEDHNVVEHRLITLESNSHLNKTKVWYDGLSSPRKIVAGFPLRDETTPYTDLEKGIVAYSDPTQGPDNGKAMLGLIFDNLVDSIYIAEGHILACSTINSTDTLNYQWGFAWDRADINSFDAWKEYLNEIKQSYIIE